MMTDIVIWLKNNEQVGLAPLFTRSYQAKRLGETMTSFRPVV